MKLKVNDLLKSITDDAPLSLQESYDNSGLIVGDPEGSVSKVLLSIDVTMEVVAEARMKKCDLIISHHPLIFKGIKKLTPTDPVSRIVMEAVQNQIAIAAMHTNLDNYQFGVNYQMAKKIGLDRLQVLQPISHALRKLVVFCPLAEAEKVRNAIFLAGGGHIGNYDQCSFNAEGLGSFRGNSETNPFVGQKGALHFEQELRIETIVPAHLVPKVVSAMLEAHPYEEVAYDIIPLENTYAGAGAGMIGYLPQPIEPLAFLDLIAERFESKVLRHTQYVEKKISKVAICGGSGAFLLPQAKQSSADAFVTADVKYHDFFDADKKLLFVDAGHFETEQFTKELIAEMIQKKFPTFAVLKSEVKTNAVQYHFKK